MAPPGFLTMTIGLTAALFVGYCVYFDRKRRSSPDFRKRLYERRRRLRTSTSPPSPKNAAPRGGPRGGDSKPVSPEVYFLTEMRAGEELITQGYVDEGLSHFANAVALCSYPDKVMAALQATLPGQMFELLISKLKGLQGMSDTATEDWSEDRLTSSAHEL